MPRAITSKTFLHSIKHYAIVPKSNVAFFCNAITLSYCIVLLDPSRRNWFRISRLVTIIAIGLRNPYAKSETGAGLVLV
jgi:hypothetical protein